jgi:DNA-binding response OmpR family regulator
MGKVILISGSNKKLNQFISDSLHRFNLRTSLSSTTEDTLQRLKTEKFDLIILDKMSDETDGIGLYESLRKDNNVPVLILTDNKEIEGDFYINKPFEPSELLTKIRIILKKYDPEFKFMESLLLGNLFVDLDKKTAFINNNNLKLTSSEFELLLLFAINNGQVVPREYIMKNLRGISLNTNERSVDVLVSRLRNKLQGAGEEEYLIKTIQSIGYMFLSDIYR